MNISQNVPKGSKSKIKQALRSRFPGGKVIQSDFTALEVYVQANLTKAAKLVEALRGGLDMHVSRLATAEGLDYEETLRKCKGYTDEAGVKHPAIPEWDYKRTASKVFSFQRAYGAGAAKIAATTGMSEEDVIALIEAEDALYPEVPAFYEKLSATLQANKTDPVTVQHPQFPGVVCRLHRATYQTPDGKFYAYREEPAPEYLVKRGTLQSFSPTQLKNYVVQGMGAEWAKAAMVLAIREFAARNNFEGRGFLVNQVHDAIYVDAHPDVAQEAAELLHACMLAASDYIAFLFNYDFPLPVPSDTTIGDSMADEDSIDVTAADQIRTAIRAKYMRGFKPAYLN